MYVPETTGGVAAFGGAALFAWVAAIFLGLVSRRQNGFAIASLTVFGSLSLLFAALFCNAGTLTIPAPFFFGDAPILLLIDPLARWFLAIIGLVGIPVSLFAPSYLRHLADRVPPGFVWAAFALLMASMAGVVLAGNALTFIVAWELMALSSFALVAADHTQRSIRRAALIYLGATRLGTAFLMAGFLWAHQLSGSWAFVDWHLTGSAALGPALLILVGLCTKAGCWPFHLWLPIAHPAAPAPVSAIMSGVMLKTAIYAMVRLFVIDAHLDHPALGTVILVLGAVSALWGVLFALLQHDIKRLLAYHSVENIGIIMMGIGMALIGRQSHLPLLTQLGLAAALFHTLNHAVFKSLLFLGAGAVDAATHLRNIERMGGLIHRMPATAACFVVGSAAICALPPLNGFASEWLLYRSFFALALSGPSMETRLTGLLLSGWLALIGGLAVACFVKVIGIAFLGAPRSKAAARAVEGAPAMSAAQIILACFCAVLGVGASIVLIPLAGIVAAPNEPRLLASAWTIPVPILAVAMFGLLAGLIGALSRLARRSPARRFITWECGFGPLGPRTQYTATSFAQPISRLFGAVYRYAVEVSVTGKQRRHFPEAVAVDTTHEAYLETRIYGPMSHAVQRVSGVFLMRLQAGSIHQYLWYMALVLALLLWVGLR